MINEEAFVEYIRKMMPDADITLVDKTGMMDHFKVRVVSEAFAEKNLLDRHRLVQKSLDEPMKDGRIHALEIKAHTPEEFAAL
ncbi:MAG: BolA/IbaG family iron-sulfur metabolism protein [Nitrospiria bacterium]